MNTICVKCGKVTGQWKGSMKHPYCAECYKVEFDDSLDRYWSYVAKTHGSIMPDPGALDTPTGRAALDKVIAEMREAHEQAQPARPFAVIVLRAVFPWGAAISDRWNSRPAGARMWQPWMWLWNLRPAVKPAEGGGGSGTDKP